MFTIRKSTDLEQVRRQFGDDEREALRKGQQRRDELEKSAAMKLGEPVYVELAGSRASVDIAPRNSSLGYTDRRVITIPIEVPPQSATNFNDHVWDKMFQKMELYHELGHIMWTNWEAFEDIVEGDGNGNYGIDQGLQQYFHTFWNVLEDASIERKLVNKYNIEKELRYKNENLLRNNQPSGNLSAPEIVTLELMEYKHSIGWINMALDPNNTKLELVNPDDGKIFEDKIKPVIDSLAPMIVAEDNSMVRTRMIYGLYRKIMDIINSECESFGLGWQVKFDFPLPDEENDQSPPKVPDPSSSQSGSNSPQKVTQGKVQWEPPEDDNVDADIQRDYSDPGNQQSQNQQSGKIQSMEEWTRIIQKDYDLDTDMKVNVIDPNPSFDQSVRDEAKRLANPLSRDLQQRLHHQQRSKKQKKQKSGKMDSKRVHKTSQGQTNVFKRDSEPDEKDYSCIIAVDRSGSMTMGADKVPDTEIAAGALSYALEDIGVETAQLALHDGDIELEKDFAEDMDQAEGKVFRGASGGGTPMSDMLLLAKERLHNRGGHPFMIVITDGKPDHRERYRDILHECNFPVLGVYITNDDSFNENLMNESAYFHHLEIRKYDDSFNGVKNLVKKVMF